MPSYEEEISTKIEKILNAIDTGKLKIGDKVYCTRILHYVYIAEFPKREIIEKYRKEMIIDKNTPFMGNIKYKRRKNGKIETTSISSIVIVQQKNFNLKFSISKGKFKSSNLSDIVHEAKNEGMLTLKTSDSNLYHYSIYAETQNALYDAFSGYFSLLDNVKWYKLENEEEIEFKFI